MNRPQLVTRAFVALSLLVLTSTAVASDLGQQIVSEVSAVSYYDYLDTYLFTHTGDNRGPNGPDLIPARDNIVSLMQSYGLAVALEPFSYSGSTYHNVVGTKVGTVYPDQEFIIGAHYDSVSNPGADDNASGVALVLEAARVLALYESEYTIRFVAFSMEEVGLVGSEAYVADHFADNILGMISADMVAYDTGTDNCNIYGRTASNPIKNDLAAAVAEYGDGLTYTIGGDTPYSDHAPFEQEGWQACLLIEGEVWSNPYYHQQTDNLENPNAIDVNYAVKMVRSVVGWLVDNANVQDPDHLAFSFPAGQPELTAPDGSTTIEVLVEGVGTEVPQPGTAVMHYDVGNGWESTPLQVVTGNLYDATFPAATCGTAISYYFSADAVSGTTYYSPRNAPTSYHTGTAAYGWGVLFEDYLDQDPGWTTEGQWAFGQPQGLGGVNYGGPDPTSGYTGDFVYGYNLSGDYPPYINGDDLTSPPIDCTDGVGVQLHFYRWLGVEQPAYDHASVLASNDGNIWQTVWQNTGEITDSDWREMTIDISSLADGQPFVQVRWRMGPTDGGWEYCGWNIDDVSLIGMLCASPALPGDMNCDGTVGFGDINPFVLALTDPAGYAAAYPNCDPLQGDLNDNGSLGFEDINPFVALLTGL